jgi:CubicO group peptidase (beta-lactamase class C family)
MIRCRMLARLGLPLLALALPFAAGAAHPATRDSRQLQVDALFSTWNKADSPGCVTGVMSQGKLVYARGYGLADVARGIALSPDTVFDIASMTKQFTAANIGLLILDRKLALTDDVRTRFPELHIDVPVIIDNLIHHTSGLRDYAELNQLRGTEATDNHRVMTLLARQKSLNFAPGSESAYSNSNYVVLAELVQRVSGKPLAQLSHERLFAPLHMPSTRYAGSLSEDPPTLANSYYPSASGQFMPVTRAAQSVGDGNLLTTVRDLARWDENFYTNRVGGKALAKLMRTPATLTNGEPVPYGFGLMFGEHRGVPTEAHGGSYHGFRTELLRFPRQHFSVSVLCNVATANASGLAAQVADIYLADALQPPPAPAVTPIEVKIDPPTFDVYAGEYMIELSGERHLIYVGRRGDQFFAQPAGESPIELFAASQTEFFAKADAGRMVFQREPDGTVSQVTLHRPAGDLVGRRIAAAAASPELLRQLAGTYYSAELEAGLRLEILGKRLIVNLAGNGRFPLSQLSDSSFLTPAGATFEFKRGADRQISELDYSSSRVRSLPFVRMACANAPTPC